ncbi:MAG: hypothetical protein ACRCX2_14075 [Paraclostridium sp.]
MWCTIEGSIFVPEGKDEMDATSKFIDLLESAGFQFGGVITEEE